MYSDLFGVTEITLFFGGGGKWGICIMLQKQILGWHYFSWCDFILHVYVVLAIFTNICEIYSNVQIISEFYVIDIFFLQ